MQAVGDYLARPGLSGLLNSVAYNHVLKKMKIEGRGSYGEDTIRAGRAGILGSLFFAGFIGSEAAALYRASYGGGGAISSYQVTSYYEMIALGLNALVSLLFIRYFNVALWRQGSIVSFVLASLVGEVLTGYIWAYFLGGLFGPQVVA